MISEHAKGYACIRHVGDTKDWGQPRYQVHRLAHFQLRRHEVFCYLIGDQDQRRRDWQDQKLWFYPFQ